MAWVFRSGLKESESGQTMIFVGVLAAILMGIMGLAVEGGRVFVEYRHMQSAADMSALIGAQKLPCGLSDTSCQQTAINDACDYARSNGFGGGSAGSGNSCTAGSGTTASAYVPPQSCSPYDFIDYGNGSSNASCKHNQPPPFYDYLETTLTDNLGTIPIFNIPVTLTTHAVAKHGIGTPGDYAIVQLDPNSPMSMGGASSSVVSGSVFANGGINGNGNDLACNGGWFSAGSITGVTTDSGGTTRYAPFGCSGTADGTTVEQGHMQPVTDPYIGSIPPPTISGNGNSNFGTFPGCTECTQNGYWYDLSTGTWGQGGTPPKKDDVELFPGIYGTLPNGGGQGHMWFLNPGVYTFTGGGDTTTLNMCVYGAPVCDDAARSTPTCPNASFTSGSAQGDQYYYQCSSFGYWDSSAIPGRPAALNTAPTWYDSSTGTLTSVPLNGVTLYLPANSGGIQDRGNSQLNFLAAPNPCPGTGTWSAGSPGSVSFTAGSSTGRYTYLGNLPDSLPHGVATSAAGVVYPSMDISLLGECSVSQKYVEWPGEMVKPQHVHFLYYIQGPGSDSFLRGTANQTLYGIIYAPTSTVQEAGTQGNAGPPWLYGQLIANDVSLTGSSQVTVMYRPCDPGATACGSGAGTQLIQ